MSSTKNTKYLLVTCCLEESRGTILRDVVDNLVSYQNIYEGNLTVFDNASTLDWVVPFLHERLQVDVHVASKNVGYWSAIQWWLTHTEQSQFTYIIESDMIHYAMDKLVIAEQVLTQHASVGAIRCQQYSVAEMHLYNKDIPTKGSKRNVWQSHTNRVTGEPVTHTHLATMNDTSVYLNQFLTQLPALNRTVTLKKCIDTLAKQEQFTELDFQRLYHDEYPTTAIIDGGIYHHDPGCVNSHVITGSWTDPTLLKKLGYLGTRFASIVPMNQYEVHVQGQKVCDNGLATP